MENQIPTSVPQGLPPTPSKVIARLTHFVTFVIFGGFSIEFFSRGAIKPISQIGILYTSLLTAYAGEKEVRRWNSLIPEESRGGKGDYIVSLWLLFYIFCWAIASLKPVYRIPPNLLTACLSVLTIFVGSKASKRFYQGRLRKRQNKAIFARADEATNLVALANFAVSINHNGPHPEESEVSPSDEKTELVNRSRTDTVLNFLKKNGGIDSQTAATILGISRRTALRTLRILASQGKIIRVGKWDKDPEGYYVLAEKESSLVRQ